jgi:3-hydroxyisobutyrate dehydrogenase-like beta-hydroxyacid dehydrogenase
MAQEKVGIIGVGRMGQPMVKHMVAKGFDVTAVDITKENLEKAAALGAKTAGLPRDLGDCSFIILGVGYDDEVNETVLGENGVLQVLNPGSIIAISSTVSPYTAQAIDEKAREKGCDVLDAPICRGRWFADNAQLLALFGGKGDVVARGREVYGAFSSDIAHLGEVGHGQVGKAMNNMMLWVTSIGLIEAGRLAETTGIDLVKLRDALMMSSGKSQALEDWDQTTFTWALKDMQIIMQMADKGGLSLPLAGAIKEMVKEGRRVKRENPPKWTGK